MNQNIIFQTIFLNFKKCANFKFFSRFQKMRESGFSLSKTNTGIFFGLIFRRKRTTVNIFSTFQKIDYFETF